MGAWVKVAVVVLGAALAACVAPSETTCGDGFVCGAGEVCRPEGGGCVDPAQVDACDGLADGTPCDFGFGPGTCADRVCVVGGCGNGTPEPGEACDDGNTTSGDGCRADCAKVEACGDALVDVGEACDDANANPVDGCAAPSAPTRSAAALLQGAVAATDVQLNYPSGIAVDRHGNQYIADTVNHRVRRLDAVTGILTTVAGTGTAGASGDGGAATAAQLASPCGVAIDGSGTIFIADTSNDRVRRIDPLTGVITTIAGSGVEGYAGDGGPATAAHLWNPYTVALDGLGAIFIADTGNNRVRRIDPTTSVITLVAGSGPAGASGDGGPASVAQLAEPRGLTIDGAGNLYVADTDNRRVRRIDNATSIITTVAGQAAPGPLGDGGPATLAHLARPIGVSLDAAGNLYVADADDHRIRRVDAVAATISTIAGDGTVGASGDGGAATLAQLSNPHAVAVAPDGRIYIADTDNQRVRRLAAAAPYVITTIAGDGAIGFRGDGGAATAIRLSYPWGVTLDAHGAIYVADSDHAQVRRIDPITGAVTTVAGTGEDGYGGDGGDATEAQLSYPWGLAVAPDDTLYIADAYNHRVRRVDAATGIISTFAGTGVEGFSGDGALATAAMLANPYGVAVAPDGGVLIADTDNNRIRRVDPDTGTITTIAGTGSATFGGDGGPAIAATMDSPYGLAVDAAGTIYVADSGNNRIRRIGTDGEIATVAGTGGYGSSGDGGLATSASLRYPTSVAVADDAGVYVADTFSNRVRRITPDGLIAAVAGTGTTGGDGDGGLATAATFAQPWAVAIDADGGVLIADTHNHRLRRIAPDDGHVLTIAGQIEPEGAGPTAFAHLTDPQAVVVAAPFTLIASGIGGVVQAIRSDGGALDTVIGRYPQAVPTDDLAAFRDATFGDVGGVAFDAVAGVIYLTETSASRLHAVTIVDPDDVATWTIATLGAGTPGFADGALATARFRTPAGLVLDDATRTLYVADAGNHVIRAIDLDALTVTTIAGTPQTLGFFGDDLAATDALLFAPTAITLAPGGDLFIADTGNHRIRRVAAGTGVITTVLGDGVAASSGEGAPAWTFPVNAPRGLATDALGNLFVTSSSTVRLLPADAAGTVDGTGPVQTIYGAAPRDTFPAFATSCLTGVAAVDAATLQVTDACSGLLVELSRGPVGS